MLRNRKEAERESFLFRNAHSHKPTSEEMPRTWTETGPRERDNTSLEAHEAQILVRARLNTSQSKHHEEGLLDAVRRSKGTIPVGEGQMEGSILIRRHGMNENIALYW